jgi:hypothetical protein
MLPVTENQQVLVTRYDDGGHGGQVRDPPRTLTISPRFIGLSLRAHTRVNLFNRERGHVTLTLVDALGGGRARLHIAPAPTG